MRPSPRAAHTTCNTPLPPGKKYVTVHLLTLETLFFVVDVRSKGEELFDQVCNFLGLNDVEMFGLALFQDGEYHFIDPSLKLSKYACKAWKAQQGTGLDSFGKPLLTLHLRVQLYVDCHLLISDKVARHHYYLQLKENVICYCQAIGEERAFLLAAYALQSDMGNYNPEKHGGNYFNPYKYFPAWIIQHVGENYITQHAPSMHRDNYGLSKGEAQVGYIKEASDSTAPHNMHFYKLKRKKSKTHSTIWLGICPKGIEIYEENGCVTKSHLSTFPWPDIAKLYFEKKKFEIRSVGCPESRKFTYFANSEETTKSLLWLCRITHQFHMAVQPRLQELKKLELEGHKQYRESYIYSDSFDLALEQGRSDIGDGTSTLPSVSSSLKKGGTSSSSSDQRVSVISNASSNTTSGIVSDKVQSFDESEDEPDEEIMINSPPAPSLESLPSSEDLGFPMSPEDRIASNNLEKLGRQKMIIGNSHQSFPSGWTSVDQRSASWTPTASVVSGSSYTSYTDSTYSSSSQLSAATVKTGSTLSHKLPSPVSTSAYTLGLHSKEEAKPKDPRRSNASGVVQSLTNDATRVSSACSIHQTESRKKISVESVPASQNQDRSPSYKNRIHNLCVKTLKCSEIPSNLSENDTAKEKQNVHIAMEQNSNCYSSNVTNITGTASSAAASQTTPTEAINVACHQIAPTRTSAMHGRTTTRIGVSSLTRVQRQPLTLYGGPVAAGGVGVAASEPNLCNPKIWTQINPMVQSPLNYFSLPPPNDSVNPSKLPTNRQVHCSSDGVLLSRVSAVPPLIYQTECRQTAMHCSSSDLTVLPPEPTSLDGEPDVLNKTLNEFPCIPPPPEYSSGSSSSPLVNGNSVFNDRTSDGSNSVNDKSSNRHQDDGKSSSGMEESQQNCIVPDGTDATDSSKGLLDLQQLREKSRDLDLPLISALCNDRSLLMLPKTVPTCSRQRHLGSCRDVRRFSCSYVPSVAFGETMASISARAATSTENIPNCPQHRPISWHLDCLDYGWLTSTIAQNQLSQNAKDKVNLPVQMYMPVVLPPTILTSFGRTPEKCNGETEGPGARGPQTKQMIPTKLLSNITSFTPNGRILAKGQSS